MSRLDDVLNGLPDQDDIQSSKLKSNYQVYKDNPAQFSNVVDLSKKTGLPVTTVENNLPEAQKRAAEPDWGDVQANAPKTSELLARDINFFRQAKDDVHGLKEIEQSFSQYQKTGAIASGFKGFMRGLGGLRELQGARFQKEGVEYLVPKQEPSLGQDVFDKADKTLPPYLREGEKQRLTQINEDIQQRNKQNLDKWNEFLSTEGPEAKALRQKHASGLIERGSEEIKAGQEFAKEWKADAYTEALSFKENLRNEFGKTALTAIAEQAPNAFVSIVAGLVTRGLGRVGSVGSMGAVSYQMEAGDIFNEGTQYLQQKYGSYDKVPSEEWGKLLTLTNEHAAFNAVLDTVMPSNLLKSKELKSFARKSLFKKVFSTQGLKEISRESIENIALELPTELVQETSSIAATEALGKEFTLEEKQNRYLQIAIGSAGIGAISGAVKGTLDVAAAKPDQSVVFKGAMDEAQKQSESVRGQGFLDRLFTATESIKNKKILNQSIDHLTDPETENVYISAQEMNTLFQDSDIPADSKTYQAILKQTQGAVQLNGDIILPLKDFIADVQGTKSFEAIRPHLRVSPGALSAAEIAQGMGTERVKALIEEAEKHVQIKEAADSIYQNVRDQLIATGRLSPQAAGYSAQIIPAYVTTQSARTGQPVEQIYRSMGLRIEGPERRAAAAQTKPTEQPAQPDLLTTKADRRQNEPRRGDRRGSEDLRAEFESLPKDEQFRIAYSEPLSGLLNKRAFDNLPPKRFRIAYDLDSLGYINDHASHSAGDTAIIETAKALIAQHGNENAFRTGGDEFWGQADTLEEAQAMAKAAQETLKNVTIRVTNPGEKPFLIKGVGLSFGIGEATSENTADEIADQQLLKDKERREASGERAKKGARPRGFADAGAGDRAGLNQEGGDLRDSQTLNQSKPPSDEGVSDLGGKKVTDTKAFRDWFKESVVTVDGKPGSEPLTVYHGGTFDEGKNGVPRIPGAGVFFTADIALADSYGRRGQVTEAYLRIENPFRPEMVDEYKPPAWIKEWINFWRKEDGWTDRASGEEMSDSDVVELIRSTMLYHYEGVGSGERWKDFLGTMRDHNDGFIGQDPTEMSGISPDTGDAPIVYVAFDPKQIKSTNNRGTFDPSDPNILHQEERGQIQFDDEGAIIRMFEASDLSTFLHEAAHLFLNTEAKFAATKFTPEHKLILEWLGAKDFQSITREQHEQWARGFEAYLLEGKAPSLDLRDAFSKFRDWLLHIYRSMTGLRVNLNPEIRAVFDRMLATDEQIAIAHSDMNYGLMFKDAKSAGMTEPEWAEYQKKKQRALDKPTSTLQEKILKELTRETEKWWKDELYAKRAEIREKLKEQRVYKATEFLKDSTGKNKLNRELVKTILGVDIVPSRLRKTTAKDRGLNPDEVAVVMGYDSGHQMLMDILANPTFTEAVNAEAEIQMKAQHGDILNDGSLEAAAIEAAHDETRGDVLLTELRLLARRTGRHMIDREALKAQAHEVISKATLSEIRPDKYRRAEIRAAEKARQAFDNGELGEAHNAKAQQLANFYLWKEANQAKSAADKQRKYLAAIPNRKYDAKDVNPEYIRQMKLLSAVYDFRKGGEDRSIEQLKAMAVWLKTQMESEETHVNPMLLDINLANALDAIEAGQPIQLKHYNDMTVEELRGVYDMVKHLRYIGGKLSENEKAVFAARTEKTAESILENGTKVVIVPEEKSKRFDAMEKLRQLGQDHLGLANHIEELDGFKEFGPMFEEFYQKIIDSSNTELKFRRELGEKLREAFKGFKSKDLRESGWIREGAGSRTITKANGESWTLTARGRIMLALYWGSPESRAAINQAHATDGDVQKMLDFITEPEADLIQKIWDINESMWPHLRDTAIEMTGVSPPKVEHVPFKIGKRDMPGGYMRIFYEEDIRDSVMTDVDAQGKLVRTGARLISNTKHGSRNSRVGSGGRKLSWDLDNVFRALDEVAHDVSFAKTASDTSRFLKSKPIRDSISYRYGKEKYKAIQQTLSNVIAGKVDGGSGLLNTLMRVPRIAGTYAFLGYSIRNLIQQPIAMTNMLGRIGEKEVLSAAMDVYWSPKKWMEFAQERSEFIRNRTALINRDIAEAIGKIDNGVLSGPLKRHAFDLQTIGDAIAVYPGWIAAYRQGLDKFANEKKAATYADEVVAETIGSGMMKDMSPLLQGKAESAKGLGPEALKLFTFMYSYFNVVGRLTRSAAKRNDLKTIQGFSQYSREMAWYLIAPALIGAWLVGSGPEEDENWFAWAAKNIGLYRLAQFVGLREMTGLIQGYSPSTPVTRALEGSARAAKLSYDIATDEKEMDWENFAKLLKGTATVVVIPGAGQAARTLDYIGSDQDEFDIYQALVTGK